MRIRLNRWLAVTFAVSMVVVLPSIAGSEPITVTGFVSLSSNGGDFPSTPEPVLELLFFFGQLSPQLGTIDSISGEAFATSPIHGTIGGLEVARPPLPDPLSAGALFDVSTLSTWTNGSLTETFLDPSCNCFESASYRSRGTFVFVGGDAVLAPAGTQLTGQSSGTFDGVVETIDGAGAPLSRRHFQGAGRATVFTSTPDVFVYQYDLRPVPEPGTWMLLGSGAVALLARPRRRSW